MPSPSLKKKIKKIKSHSLASSLGWICNKNVINFPYVSDKLDSLSYEQKKASIFKMSKFAM